MNLTGFDRLERLEVTGCTNLRTITTTGLPRLAILSMRECRGIRSWSVSSPPPSLHTYPPTPTPRI